MYIMPNLPTNHTKKTVDRFVFTQTYLLSPAFMNMIIMPSLLTVSIAIITSILIGVISSVVPANKAALANTIDILK